MTVLRIEQELLKGFYCLCTQLKLGSLFFFYALSLVFDEYKKIAKKEIEASIKSEMSGHFEDALLAVGTVLIMPLSLFLTQ